MLQAEATITAIKQALAAQPAVQGPQDGELIRGHFEADYTTYYRHADLTWDPVLETYKNERTRAAWHGWQCCTRNTTTPPAQPAVPKGMKLVPLALLERAAESLGSFVSDHGWSQSDMDTFDELSLLTDAPEKGGAA
jgi:hypothetical protein